MKSSDADKLKELYRGELSAVETYELGLKHVKDTAVSDTLRELRDGHQRRVGLIRGRLGAFGGELPASSGVWGAFAKTVQAGADLLGTRSAIAALEQGEDRGMKMYRGDFSECDADTRMFIENELRPEQEKSHATCSALKKQMKAA
jgi:hypothetical protein